MSSTPHSAPSGPAATETADPLSLFRLDGRVVLLTGASSGLGHRFAGVLHAAGAKVVMAARRKERLDELAAALPGSIAMACDVGDESQRERLVRDALDAHGRIDVLVNNAGTETNHRPELEPLSEWRRVHEVNLEAPFHLAQLCVRDSMIANKGGAIVNMASMLGLVASGQLTQASYASTKGALVNLTRELACNWARHGVRVNALCPGWFATEMNTALIGSDSGAQWIERKTPMRRVGAAHELDGPLLLLCSDAGSFMTGSTLVVDGGWTAQ